MFAQRAWRRLLSCRRGSSFIEFAFIAPAVFLAISGIIDLMMVMFVTSLMEGGLQDASRLGRTGFQPVTGTREQAIIQRIGDATVGLVDMNQVNITTTVYPSFEDINQPEPYTDVNGNGQWDADQGNGTPEPFQDVNGNGTWDPDMGATGLGGPGSVVLYQVSYDWSLLTPLVADLITQNGKIPITASVAVRNEPFGTVAPPLGS